MMLSACTESIILSGCGTESIILSACGNESIILKAGGKKTINYKLQPKCGDDGGGAIGG